MINNRNTKTLKNFGKHLFKLRKERGLSQEELTFRSELSKNMIGNIERGEVNLTLTTIMALAKGLDIPVSNLLDF